MIRLLTNSFFLLFEKYQKTPNDTTKTSDTSNINSTVNSIQDKFFLNNGPVKIAKKTDTKIKTDKTIFSDLVLILNTDI